MPAPMPGNTTTLHLGATLAICTVIAMLPASFPLMAADRPAPLLDGQSLSGWMTLDGGPVTDYWEVADGMIHLSPSGHTSGHIITARDVGNFVLSFDFKIAPGGNSGVKYRVQDYGGRMLGCEYQIVDDDHPQIQANPASSTGALYDIYEPAGDRVLHPAGQFNTARIVVQDNLIEHWLNGRCILKVCVGSPEWDRRIAASKFHDEPGFGENRCGRLMLTDHGSEVWFRNLRFVDLSKDQPHSAPSLAYSDAAVLPGGTRCTISPAARKVTWQCPPDRRPRKRISRRCVPHPGTWK